MPDGSDVTTEATPQLDVAKRPKTKTSFDAAKYVVTIHEPGADPVHYDLSALSADTSRQLIGKGTAAYLTQAPDGHAEAYKRLKAGEYSNRKPAAPKVMDPWRQAIAHAAVEDTKKSDTPMSIEDAKAKAAALPIDEVKKRKTHAGVLKHYHKITGTAPVATLL